MVKKYLPRPKPVEAIQFLADGSNTDEVMEFLRRAGATDIRFYDQHNDFWFVKNGESYYLSPKKYVIVDHEKNISIHTQEGFHRRYQEIVDTPG